MQSALLEAARQGSVKGLARACSKEAVETRDNDAQTALHIAAYEGHTSAVLKLIEVGANVNAEDKNKWTALHCAASSSLRSEQHLEIVEILLRNGASANAITNSQTSVLHYLVRYPFSEKLLVVLNLLIDLGADVDVREVGGETPVHQACFRGSAETVKFLAERGAGLSNVDKVGETPLHLAARAGKKDVVEVLLKYDADPFVCGPNGTPKDVAFLSNQQEVIDLLEEHETAISSACSQAEPADGRPDASYSSSHVERPVLQRLGSMISSGRDAGDVFGFRNEPDGDGAVPSHSRPKSGTQSYLVRSSRTDSDRCVVSNPGFNFELGSRAAGANELSLEYTDEHDDFYFTMNFCVNPEEACSMAKVNLAPESFHPHINFVGFQDAKEVIVTVGTVCDELSGYRGIIRAPHGDKTFWLRPEQVKKAKPKELIKALVVKYPSLKYLCVVDDVCLSNALVSLDMLLKIQRYKFGVIYCAKDQQEEQIFSTQFEDTSPAFQQFLTFLGEKVELKGWQHYKGDLDVKNDGMGTHSYYRKWRHLEVMYEVAPMMGELPSHRRKALIGNTIVTIVWQEDGQFDPSLVVSQVLHVFIIIQPVYRADGTVMYRVATAAKKGVPRFRPSLPLPPLFALNESFLEFLYHKLINAERAAYHCSTKVRRQRRSLVEIVQDTRAGQMEYALSKVPEKKLKALVQARATFKKE
eukprot:TRINITY_DN5496_c0_g1_i1.p1 TRINITY_DN5496_c0_g1~~TRINITY_DN5496_c0_g1_i1.p1  ORF type:complete len:698 (+),score=150.84 TRINITY_DN5496_c0_g1_i1:401-2494(+)